MQAVNNQIEIDASINKTFWRYALPSIFAMLVNGLYQVIDGIFVGHYLGSSGLAAINMAIPVLGTITGFGIMIGMGGGSLMSRYRGQKSAQKEQRVLASSLWLVVICAMFGVALLTYFSAPLLMLQGGQEQVLQYGLDYLQVFNYGVVASIAATALPILIRNDNSPKLATALIILGALLNIVLDYLFIGVWQLGLRGVAIATVISQLCVVVIACLYFFSHFAQCRVKLFSASLTYSFKIMHLGASSLFMFFYFAFIIALHNKLFISYGSTVHVAAFAIVSYTATLYYLISEGIAAGLQPPVSYYLGAQQNNKIMGTVKIAVNAVLLFGITTTILLNLFPDTLINLFAGHDEALTKAATRGIQLHLFALCLDGFLFIATVYYMAVGEGTKSILVSLGNMLVQLPFLYLLPLLLDVNGVWLALPLSNVLLTVIIAPMLYKDVHVLCNHKLKRLPAQPITQSVMGS